LREVKAFRNALIKAWLNDAIIVADKGFYSKDDYSGDSAGKAKVHLAIKTRQYNC